MTNPITGRGWSFPPVLDERGTISLTNDTDEIEQAIHIILNTVPGQRVMRPEFGCRIHELVFAPNNTATAGLAQRYVREALGRWEPRIEVQRVDVVPNDQDAASLLINIEYRISQRNNIRSLVYPFYMMQEETPTVIRRSTGG